MKYIIGNMQFDSNYLEHHGISGMKWGERNGPPYPLSRQQKSDAEKKALATDIHKRTLAAEVKRSKPGYLEEKYFKDVEFYKAALTEIGVDLNDARIELHDLKSSIFNSEKYESELKQYAEKRVAEANRQGLDFDYYDLVNDLRDPDWSAEADKYIKWLIKRNPELFTDYKLILLKGNTALKNRKECIDNIIDDIVGQYKVIPAKISSQKMPSGYEQVKVEDFLKRVILEAADEWTAEAVFNERG